MRGIIALGLSIVLLGACSSPEQAENPSPAGPVLTGEVWKWVGTDGAAPASVDRPTHYTLEFLPDGRYSVRADCNSGAGSWSLNAGTFSMTGGAMTLVACGPASLDSRFLELLGEAGAVTRDGDALMLTTGEATMRFLALPKLELAGTSWLVRAVNNGKGAVTSVVADTELTIEFAEAGQVGGSAGCNRFTGSFTVDAQTVTFSPLATTRMTCMGDGVVEQEQYYLAALSSVATWEIRGERAQLRSAEGTLAVDLVSAVTGTAIIDTRQALPEGAVLSVQLQDTSVADASAVVLGEQTMPTEGAGLQLPFEVSFDPAEIDARMSYSLRATVRAGDELLFTTTQHYPVLTRDGGQFGIELHLQPAGE